MYRNILAALLLAISLPAVIEAQVVYSNDQVEVIQLDDNIFLLKENFKFTANCLAIVSKDEILLLDSGFEEVGADLVDAIIFLKKEVKVIVNSHSHADHVGANALFGPDVTVIGHESCREAYAKHGQEVKSFDSNWTFDFNGHLVFCMAYTGGHSECDIITFIPDLRLAYLGDLYLSESFPLVVTDAGSSVETLLHHLNEIFESLPDDTRMFPGHGKETTMEYFGGYIAMVEETVNVVRKKMKPGRSLQEIQAANLLEKWEGWGKFFPFISTETWVEQIYHSYSNK